jgi:hypothetical protein
MMDGDLQASDIEVRAVDGGFELTFLEPVPQPHAWAEFRVRKVRMTPELANKLALKLIAETEKPR